jgi:hypothetical protein
MATPCQPLGIISSNRQFNGHLSPYMRGQIAGRAATGQKAPMIVKDLNLVLGIVKYTIWQDKLRNDGYILPKKPRRKTYTPYQERLLIRHVQLHPKDIYTEVIIACNLDCKTSIIKTILKKYGIANWRAKKRPELTEAHAAARLT